MGITVDIRTTRERVLRGECPFCGAEYLDDDCDLVAGNDYAKEEIFCRQCRRAWQKVYSLLEIVDLDTMVAHSMEEAT